MRYYTEDHLWLEVHGNEALIGITEYASSKLTEIEQINLPAVNTDFNPGDPMGDIILFFDKREYPVQMKMVLTAPIACNVLENNEDIIDSPQILIDNPEDEDQGWICRVGEINESDCDDLMNEEDYYNYTNQD